MSYLDIEGHSLDLMLERNRGVIGSSVVRRSLLQSLPPVPEGVRPGEDHLLLTLVAREAEWHLVPSGCSCTALHAGQDTRRADPAAARSIIRSRVLAWQLAGGRANFRSLHMALSTDASSVACSGRCCGTASSASSCAPTVRHGSCYPAQRTAPCYSCPNRSFGG